MKTAEERFAEKWRKDENGCHVWTAAKNSNGYGSFYLGRTRPAHRVAWDWARGPVQDGKQLDHLCRNRACVNVDHLEPVTCRENVLRGVGFAAVNSKLTHCPKGHQLQEIRMILVHGKTKRHRRCRECERPNERMSQRKRRAEAKAKRASEKTGLDSLFGQWPGDETDAQLAVALMDSQ